MIRLIALVFMMTFAVPALADYPEGSHKSAQTRFGVLQVLGEVGSQRIVLGGTDLGIESWSVSVDGVWAVQGEAHDWVVLTVHYGGNGCVPPKMIVKLTQTQATRTEGFGPCNGVAKDVLFHAGAIELVFSDSAPEIAERRFRFDGVNMVETPVAVVAAPDTLSGRADVTRWLGQHPQRLLQDPSEQARLGRILTPAQLNEMNIRMSGPGETKQQGDWVVGRACQAHQCGTKYAMWALRVTDGRPIAILFEDVRSESGAPNAQVFGTGQGDWNDPQIRAFLEETLP